MNELYEPSMEYLYVEMLLNNAGFEVKDSGLISKGSSVYGVLRDQRIDILIPINMGLFDKDTVANYIIDDIQESDGDMIVTEQGKKYRIEPKVVKDGFQKAQI